MIMDDQQTKTLNDALQPLNYWKYSKKAEKNWSIYKNLYIDFHIENKQSSPWPTHTFSLEKDRFDI